MPNKCNLPPVLPANAADITTANLFGDSRDEVVYVVKDYRPRKDGLTTYSEPVARLYIAVATAEPSGASCTWGVWRHVLLQEQSLKEVRPDAGAGIGGWGMQYPPTGTDISWLIQSAGYQVFVGDFDGDGQKEIFTNTIWHDGREPTRTSILNVEEVVKQKLAAK